MPPENDVSTKKGRKGEEIAASFLESKGYKIVKRNFRAYGAEIDLVAVRDDTTVFAEVKFWDVYGFNELERTLDRKKRARIIRASKGFLEAVRFISTEYELIGRHGDPNWILFGPGAQGPRAHTGLGPWA